jgi:fatty acid desaturase
LDEEHNKGRPDREKGTNNLRIALIAIGVVVVLTWAVTTVFEIAIAKALASVVLIVFGVLVLLFMTGLG